MKINILLSINSCLLIIFAFVSCGGNPGNKQQNLEKNSVQNKVVNDIPTKIGYSDFGGESGLFETLEITRDSINYNYDIAAKNQRKSYQIATPKSLWGNLLSEYDAATFKKIKSGESFQLVDGTDQVFFIESPAGNLSFMNGHGDEYKQLSGFFDLIVKAANDCREKAVEK